MKFKIIHFKHILNLSIFFIILISLIIFAKIDFTSIKDTIDVYLSITFPSLFPFILFVQICLNTDIFTSLKKTFKFIPKIFNLSSNTSIIIILSYIAGFPSGATLTNKLYKENYITKKDVDILTTFTNNCSPIFIIVTIGLALLNSIKLGILLLISHFISSIIIGFIYSKIYTYIIHENSVNLKCKCKKYSNIDKKNLTLFDILSKSLNSSFKICLNMLRFHDIFQHLSRHFNTYFKLLKLN